MGHLNSNSVVIRTINRIVSLFENFGLEITLLIEGALQSFVLWSFRPFWHCINCIVFICLCIFRPFRHEIKAIAIIQCVFVSTFSIPCSFAMLCNMGGLFDHFDMPWMTIGRTSKGHRLVWPGSYAHFDPNISHIKGLLTDRCQYCHFHNEHR